MSDLSFDPDSQDPIKFERINRLRQLFPDQGKMSGYRFLAHLDDLPAYVDLIPRILTASRDVRFISFCSVDWTEFRHLKPRHSFASGDLPQRLNCHFLTVEERRAWIIENLLRPLGV